MITSSAHRVAEIQRHEQLDAAARSRLVVQAFDRRMDRSAIRRIGRGLIRLGSHVQGPCTPAENLGSIFPERDRTAGAA